MDESDSASTSAVMDGEPNAVWSEALAELDCVAQKIQKLAAEVQQLARSGACAVDTFERFRQELEASEVESKRVKDKLRDGMKLFKKAGLPPPSKQDKANIEVHYTTIKEELAKARNELRDAALKAKVLEATRSLQNRRVEMKAFLDEVLADDSLKKKDVVGEVANIKIRLEAVKKSVESGIKICQNAGVEKGVAELQELMAETEGKIQAHCEKLLAKAEEAAASLNASARSLADSLTSFKQWIQARSDELNKWNFSNDELDGPESVFETRIKALLDEGETLRGKVTKFKGLKVPTADLDRLWADLQAAITKHRKAWTKHRQAREKLKKAAEIEPAAVTGSSFVQEPVFEAPASIAEEAAVVGSGFNEYGPKLRAKQQIFTPDELQKVIDSGYKINYTGLTMEEFGALLQDLALAISQGVSERSEFESDSLFALCVELFEKAAKNDKGNPELRINAATAIIDWTSLRLKMNSIIYKGMAVFPFIDKATAFLVQVIEKPHFVEKTTAPPPQQPPQKTSVSTAAQLSNVAREKMRLLEGIRSRTIKMDDSTSARMRVVLQQQEKELLELEKLARKI